MRSEVQRGSSSNNTTDKPHSTQPVRCVGCRAGPSVRCWLHHERRDQQRWMGRTQVSTMRYGPYMGVSENASIESNSSLKGPVPNSRNSSMAGTPVLSPSISYLVRLNATCCDVRFNVAAEPNKTTRPHHSVFNGTTKKANKKTKLRALQLIQNRARDVQTGKTKQTTRASAKCIQESECKEQRKVCLLPDLDQPAK